MVKDHWAALQTVTWTWVWRAGKRGEPSGLPKTRTVLAEPIHYRTPNSSLSTSLALGGQCLQYSSIATNAGAPIYRTHSTVWWSFPQTP